MKLSVDQASKELAADLAEDLGHPVTQKAAKAVLTRVFTYVADTLAEGHELNVPGFAKFRVVAKPERQVRNPSTGETSMKPASKAVKITVAKALKDRVGA